MWKSFPIRSFVFYFFRTIWETTVNIYIGISIYLDQLFLNRENGKTLDTLF